jgi:hypothetical protein
LDRRIKIKDLLSLGKENSMFIKNQTFYLLALLVIVFSAGCSSETMPQCNVKEDCGHCQLCTGGTCVFDSNCEDYCKDVTCEQPDPPECIDDNTLKVYQLPGTCSQGSCVYAHNVINCPSGCDANAGACLGCDNKCFGAGLTECTNGQIRSCLVDENGCFDWSSYEPCADGFCANASSCGGCDDQCVAGQTECTNGEIRTCMSDDKGCFDWGDFGPCSDGYCLDANTCGGCNNECDQAGTSECNNNEFRTCQVDANGCLYWGDYSPCQQGTSCNQTTGECEPNATGCEDNTQCVEPLLCDLVSQTCVEFCPLLTFECALGCCPEDAVLVSTKRSINNDIAVDADGNIYVTYAHLNPYWESEIAVYSPLTGDWTRFTHNIGNYRPQVLVSSTGRVHHLYMGHNDEIKVQYSDDQGVSWNMLAEVPGLLDIGGVCLLGIASSDFPQLFCGLQNPYPYDLEPTWLRYVNGSWEKEMLSFGYAVTWDTNFALGFSDRPHVLYAHGSADAFLQYTYYTGSQWNTEAVQFPEGIIISPEYQTELRPGFALESSNDTLHIAWVGYNLVDECYEAWYGKKSVQQDWQMEKVIDSSQLGGEYYTNVDLTLDENQRPVFFTWFGSGAFQDTNGNWHLLQVGEAVDAVAVLGKTAYVTFLREGQNYEDQRTYLKKVGLNP